MFRTRGIIRGFQMAADVIQRTDRVGGWSRMPKPLSIDLRERVLAAVAGGRSRRAAAERFGVAPSTAIKWVATWRGDRPRPSPHRGRRPTFASDRDPRRGDSGVAGGDPRCHAGRSDGRPCASAWPPGEPQHGVAILCASGHHVQEEDRARLRAGTPRCGTAPTGVAGWPTRSGPCTAGLRR